MNLYTITLWDARGCMERNWGTWEDMLTFVAVFVPGEAYTGFTVYNTTGNMVIHWSAAD